MNGKSESELILKKYILKIIKMLIPISFMALGEIFCESLKQCKSKQILIC